MEADAEVNKKKVEQLNADVKKGNDMISSLKKDIDGFKKEIQERDDTIQDKVEIKINIYKLCKFLNNYFFYSRKNVFTI